MIKSSFIKNTMKAIIVPILSGINKLIPKRKDYIFLYSANLGIRHNLAVLKDKLLIIKIRV